MAALIDLTDRRFGRLVVLQREGTYTNENDPYIRMPTWRCLCDCGTETVVLGNNLRQGATTSCGCLRREKRRKKPQT